MTLRKTLTLLVPVMSLVIAPLTWAQQKPRLKTPGASQALLAAPLAAKHPEPASAKKPINQIQVFTLLAGHVPSHRIASLVQECGIDFEPTDDYLREVRLAGGEDELIGGLKNAKATKPVDVAPELQAQQAEVLKYAVLGAQSLRQKQYAHAQTQFRKAVRLDPQNAELHLALSTAFNGKGKWDSAIAEEREAVRLDPTLAQAHVALAIDLMNRHIRDGVITEAREAVRLDPENENAHVALGIVLQLTGDLDGEIAEQREALRLNPNDSAAHYDLGFALLQKGDRQAALQEYHAACQLRPNNPIYRHAYQHLLRQVKP
jgi:Flp pilus assembly protein TadD